MTGCGSSFDGKWICTNDSNEKLTISKISKKTYEVDFGSGMTFSGEVNDDDVLVVEMLGNVSRLSINKGKLQFSGILAPCKEYQKD